MICCVFRKSFLSEKERDDCVPNINNVLLNKQYDYKFINVAWSAQAETESWKYLGELVMQHLGYLNDAFYYVCGYFNVIHPEEVVFNYRDLVNVTHNF